MRPHNDDRAKADQERLVATARPDAIILRSRAVWGPGDTTLLPRVLARIRNGWLPLPDGGRHLASTTNVSSLALAVVAAIERPAVSGPVNVADATPTTTAELLGTLFDAMNVHVRIVPIPESVAWFAAGVVEAAWSLAGRRSEPFLTRYAVAGLSHPFTLDLGRLQIRPRHELPRRRGSLRGSESQPRKWLHFRCCDFVIEESAPGRTGDPTGPRLRRGRS